MTVSHFTYQIDQGLEVFQAITITDTLFSEISAGSHGETIYRLFSTGMTAEDSAHERGRGWVVGGLVPSLEIPVTEVSGGAAYARMAVTGWLMSHADDIAKRSETVGFWIDNGVVFFDAGTSVADEHYAHSRGRVRGEKEIYNIVTGKCEPVRS